MQKVFTILSSLVTKVPVAIGAYCLVNHSKLFKFNSENADKKARTSKLKITTSLIAAYHTS